MRKLLPLFAAALLGACGDDGDDGGDVPAATALTVAHPSFGSATATDAAGFTGQASCSFPQFGVPTATGSFALVVASTAAPVCAAVTNAQVKAGATTVVIGIVRGRAGATAPTIDPGTYSVTTGPLIDLTSNLSWAFAEVTRIGAVPTCAQTPIAVTGGSVTVASNTGGTVRGTVALQLADGGTVNGTFVGNACATPASIDVAQACNGVVPDVLASPACVP